MSQYYLYRGYQQKYLVVKDFYLFHNLYLYIIFLDNIIFTYKHFKELYSLNMGMNFQTIQCHHHVEFL